MKKIALTLSLLLFVSLSVHARDTFFNDSIRKTLKQYLVDKRISGFPEAYDAGNLSILNLISMEYVEDNPQAGEYKYGIYSFCGDMVHGYSYILMRRNDEYEILEMSDMWNGKSLIEIMIELIAYFYRHPDVPNLLFPLYVEAVSYVDYENSHWEIAQGIDIDADHPKESIYRLIEKSNGEPIEYFIE
jgi:hypothetical protein